MDLTLTFASLLRYHIATPSAPLPSAEPGIAWIWAQDGIYKRGITPTLDLLIPVAIPWETQAATIAPPFQTPGLVRLLPHIKGAAWPGRVPGRPLLVPLLSDAQRAVSSEGIGRPIEKQYFIVRRGDALPRLIAPRAQQGTPGRVRYAVPPGETILIDIHSHHEMPAYFSGIDDADDTGLSISVVIGRIFTRPEMVCRLNVYGHHSEIPATLLFDDLGPFVDRLMDVPSEVLYATCD